MSATAELREEIRETRPHRRSRRWLLGNIWRTLAGLLGLMQASILQWVAVVVFGTDGLGLFVGSVLGVGLVVANLVTLPTLRRARQGRGPARGIARVYMSGGICTILVGLGVAVSWLGLLPLATVLGWGIGAEPAFELFRVGSAGLVAFTAFVAVWGFTGGQRKVDHTHVRLPLAGIHEAHRGLRIGHLTDLHIGNGLEGERLDRMVARANALDVDLLVLTGDIFDFDPAHVEDGARRLGALRAPLGVFAVLGNHDAYTGTETVVAALAEHAPGIRLLRDEFVRLPLDAPFHIGGIEDPGRDWTARGIELASLTRLAESMPQEGSVLLLVHRPEAFPQASRLGFPLVLAGHTHGGQLALPTRGGQINLARVMSGFTRGVYRLNGSTLYVNRGIGVAGPAIRFNCPRELAVVELV